MFCSKGWWVKFEGCKRIAAQVTTILRRKKTSGRRKMSRIGNSRKEEHGKRIPNFGAGDKQKERNSLKQESRMRLGKEFSLMYERGGAAQEYRNQNLKRVQRK